MIHVFIKQGVGIIKKEAINDINNVSLSNGVILWIDLLHPTAEEIAYISKTYALDVPTKEEREEIEESARYFEDANSITINTYFLIRDSKLELNNETITFILFGGILFTIRYADFKVFNEIQQNVLTTPRDFVDNFDLLSGIFELRVEQDADMIEGGAKLTKLLRKAVFEQDSSERITQLTKLSQLQELTMSVRDSLFDKRRAISMLLRSNKVDSETKKELVIVLKDLNSIVDFTTANLTMLDNTQTLFTSQVNVEQNKIIKLFTVATMAMMPPTLIGTIYGMNFKFMPELEWEYAYPVVLVVMIVSTIMPVIYFKKKGWL